MNKKGEVEEWKKKDECRRREELVGWKKRKKENGK